MKTIPLSNSTDLVLVNDSDYEGLSRWKWRKTNHGYAARVTRLGTGRSHWIWMHRYINQTPEGLDTDHINGNRLDNRRENLRSLCRMKNLWNRHHKPHSHTGLSGVSTVSYGYTARIRANGKQRYLGFFKNMKDANTAYLEALQQRNSSIEKGEVKP
jgi:hypothetical protein